MSTPMGLHSEAQSHATQMPGAIITPENMSEFCQILIRNSDEGIPTRIPRLNGWQLGSLLKSINLARLCN